MDLANSLTATLRGYKESVALLNSYLRHVDTAVTKLHVQHQRLAARFEAAKAGEADPNPPKANEEIWPMELTEHQVDLVIKVMKWSVGQSAAYPNITHRMSFVYLVALFDAFLSDAFSAVAKARPGILKSSKKQISYERVLEFGSIGALIEFIVTRELNELSYKSIGDQAEYYKDRFGVSLGDSGIAIAALVELRATRNLLVHNNGIVNQIFIELVPETTLNIGDAVKIDASYLEIAMKNLAIVAEFATRRLIDKHARPVAKPGDAA